MPTERFNKLPEEKKKAIRDAAMEECIRVPFEKVSINKIIQNAGISRGSFYTYFEDKRDLVRYIFSDTADKLKILLDEVRGHTRREPVDCFGGTAGSGGFPDFAAEI